MLRDRHEIAWTRSVDLDVALSGARGDDEARQHVDQAITIRMKKVDVPAARTIRNSTSITMNSTIDSMWSMSRANADARRP